MNEKTLKLLEFDKIRECVAECAASGPTKEKILESTPIFDKFEVERLLQLTDEAHKMLNKFSLNPIVAFDDVTHIVAKAQKDATLGMGELLKIARLLRSARIAQATIASAPDEIVLLKQITAGLMIDKPLEKSIFDCIISETEMSDTASDKLYGLRRKILALNSKLKEKLMSYTRNNNSSKYLQDNLVTIREGRYVLPVKAECRSEVQGLVHDRSATGSTVFVEPFAIVELNNELRTVIAEEQAEVERILYEFSVRVAKSADMLFVCQNTCIMFDEVFCKAKYSTKIRGVFPQILGKNTQIYLKEARHPLIDTQKVVPVDIKLGQEYGILLITGPNTGGKTVCLKTTGLFCLMAYFGLFLPCVCAELSIFDDIFCDIGDEQSIENELSTFSSHVKNLIYITENMTDRSLVLLDEVGGGTDPSEGSALAVGIVKFIEKKRATALLTTHYGELKEYAMTTDYVENACMQFNEQTLLPTFKLITGMPGTSNALNIAGRLGLNAEIIENARSAMNAETLNFEKILQNAEKIKRESLLELENARKLKQGIELEKADLEERRFKLDEAMERIKNNAAAETRRLVSNSMDKANEIIEQMKAEITRADEAALLRAKHLRNDLEDISYRLSEDKITAICDDISINEIQIGAQVIVKSLGTSGTVRSINAKRKQAEVQVGAITTKVAFTDLGKPFAEKKAQNKQNNKISKHKMHGEQAKSGFTEVEIKVLGLTVSEAIEVIEPHILSMCRDDDAKILKIVHGKGTGALAKGIHAYLKSNSDVAEFRYGRYGEGDNGVTFATIK